MKKLIFFALIVFACVSLQAARKSAKKASDSPLAAYLMVYHKDADHTYKFFHIGNSIIKCTKIMFFHKNPNQLEKVFFYVWCKEYLLHWKRPLILGRKRFRSSSPVIARLILLLVLIVLTTRVSCTICGSSSIGSYFFIYYF